MAILALSVLITPLIVRLLGSAQYGDYAFLLSVVGVTMIVANAGIFDGTRKYLAEDRGRSEWVENVFGFYFRVALLLAILAAGAYAVASWLDLPLLILRGKFKLYFYLIGILIICRQLVSVARGGLMGLGLEHRSEPLKVLRKVLFAVIGLSLAFVGYGVAGVLVGHILASLTVAMLSFVWLFQHISISSIVRRAPVGFPKRELLTYNALSVLLILLTASLYHVDVVLVRLLVGNDSTGYYKAALVVAEFLWLVPNALQTILLHTSSEMWSNQRDGQISRVASKVTRYNLSLGLFFSISLIILAPDFIPLYFGSEFTPAIFPLLLLVPGTLGFALARPIFAVVQGKGQLRILIVATGIAAVLNVWLNLVLIPSYGVEGAAVATSISYGLMLVFHVAAAHHAGFNPISDLRVLRIATGGLAVAVIMFVVSSWISLSIATLLLTPLIGGVLYVSLMMRLSVLSQDDIAYLVRRLPDPVDRFVQLIASKIG